MAPAPQSPAPGPASPSTGVTAGPRALNPRNSPGKASPRPAAPRLLSRRGDTTLSRVRGAGPGDSAQPDALGVLPHASELGSRPFS